MKTATKPVPVPTEADRPFWDGLMAGRLMLSRCDACGYHIQRAKLVCPKCRGESSTWCRVSGRGTIFSYTVAQQTWVSGFEDELPYVVVAVAVEEEPSLLITTNLVGDWELENLDIGLPVEAVFEKRGDQSLLQFRLSEPNAVR